MQSERKRIVLRSLLVTAIAVTATFGLSFPTRWFLGMPIDWLAWIECVVIPVVIAFPVSWYIFSQAEALRRANWLLTQSHSDLESAHKRLTFVSRHDQMTGLLNRDGFLDRLERAVGRGGEGFLLIVDADHFKQINDKYGHPKGDEALRKIAQALRYSVRASDAVGRIGGEEFALLLTGIDRREAEQVAELTRRHVELIPWEAEKGERHRLTVSIGAADLRRHGANASEALRVADRCLYAAKNRGRNQVVFDYIAEAVA